MGNDDLLTDDYVAGLLADEAKDCSLKYSALGMEAFDTRKKPNSMPKPNTRFLRHIIKGTDFHNKTLLAKEAAESKARLKNLERASETKRLKTNPSTRDIRKRQMGDIQAILGGSKRSRNREDKSQNEASTSKAEDSRQQDEPSQKKRARSREHSEERESDKRHRKSSEKDKRSRQRRSSHNDDDHRSRHSRDEEGRDRHSTRHGEKRRHRSKSPRRRRSRSPSHRDKERTRHRRRSTSRDRRRSKKDQDSNQLVFSDAESLDEFIGPAPAPKLRGRGASGFSSGIDRRFSESYDPKLGTGMDDDDAKLNPGWEQAVEEFRDRKKLQQEQQ